MDGIIKTSVRCTVTAILAYAVGSFVVRWKILNETKKYLPPAPDYGFIEYLTNLLGPQGPQFALKNARKIGYVSRTPGVPSLLQNMVWVNVAEPNLVRTILEDPEAEKPWQAYEFFDKNLSGENFFTANGKRANHVRKSTSVAFSAQNMKKMAEVVDEILDRRAIGAALCADGQSNRF